MFISNGECILHRERCSVVKDVLRFPSRPEKGSSVWVEITAKAAWGEHGWFCTRSPRGPGSGLTPTLSQCQRWLQFPLCAQISLASLCTGGHVLAALLDTAHTPSISEKQIKALFAPRIHLHRSCVISWLSGSSEPSGQMQLLVNCTKPCAFTRRMCCGWPGGLCFLDCLKNSFLLY